MTASRPTLAQKLAEIGRRSPEHLAALETLADFALRSLDAGRVPDPKTYRWRCDAPRPVWKRGDPTPKRRT